LALVDGTVEVFGPVAGGVAVSPGAGIVVTRSSVNGAGPVGELVEAPAQSGLEHVDRLVQCRRSDVGPHHPPADIERRAGDRGSLTSGIGLDGQTEPALEDGAGRVTGQVGELRFGIRQFVLGDVTPDAVVDSVIADRRHVSSSASGGAGT
jgi:hypothetical protein